MIEEIDSGVSSGESEVDEPTFHLQNYLCVTGISETVYNLLGYHHICNDCVNSLIYRPMTKIDSLWHEEGVSTVKQLVILFHTQMEKGIHIPNYYYCVCNKILVQFSEAVDCLWCKSIFGNMKKQ